MKTWKGIISASQYASMLGVKEQEIHELCDSGEVLSDYVQIRVIHGTWMEDEDGQRFFEPI